MRACMHACRGFKKLSQKLFDETRVWRERLVLTYEILHDLARKEQPDPMRLHLPLWSLILSLSPFSHLPLASPLERTRDGRIPLQPSALGRLESRLWTTLWALDVRLQHSLSHQAHT